jgi:hypothetical protein
MNTIGASRRGLVLLCEAKKAQGATISLNSTVLLMGFFGSNCAKWLRNPTIGAGRSGFAASG